MRHCMLLLVVAGVVVFGGCSRVSVTTDVKKDGSWSRTDTFTQSKSGMPGSSQLSDVFVMPSKAPWNVKKTATKDEVKVVTSLAVNGPAQVARDILVRRKNNGPVLVSNSVEVRKVSAGVWQYTEKLHWEGAKPKEFSDPPPEVISGIKQALPPAVATDANAKALAPGIVRGFLGCIFGPEDSILPDLMLRPDAAEHTLRRSLGKSIDKALGETFGSRLTPEERRNTVRRLISSAVASAKTSSSASPDSPGSSNPDGTDMPSLTFTLRPPGRITSSNGEIDDYANEVYWTLYPEAAALGDVTLKATWQM